MDITVGSKAGFDPNSSLTQQKPAPSSKPQSAPGWARPPGSPAARTGPRSRGQGGPSSSSIVLQVSNAPAPADSSVLTGHVDAHLA